LGGESSCHHPFTVSYSSVAGNSGCREGQEDRKVVRSSGFSRFPLANSA
jgi:hypothetical protein